MQVTGRPPSSAGSRSSWSPSPSAGAVGTKQIDQQDANVGQAHRADQILKQAGFQTDPQTEIVLVQSKQLTIERSGLPRDRRTTSIATVAPFAAITKNLRSPLAPGATDQVSADGHTAMVEWRHEGRQRPSPTKRIDRITDRHRQDREGRHPGFYVGEAGSISSGKALNDAFNQQLAQAGERSVPLTLIVLLLVFGALVAAGLPLLLALTAVIATIGLDRPAEPSRPDGPERQRRRCCSSGSPSASTTRSSTSSASVRSGPPARARGPRSRPPRRPPAARCSSPA